MNENNEIYVAFFEGDLPLVDNKGPDWHLMVFKNEEDCMEFAEGMKDFEFDGKSYFIAKWTWQAVKERVNSGMKFRVNIAGKKVVEGELKNVGFLGDTEEIYFDLEKGEAYDVSDWDDRRVFG